MSGYNLICNQCGTDHTDNPWVYPGAVCPTLKCVGDNRRGVVEKREKVLKEEVEEVFDELDRLLH